MAKSDNIYLVFAKSTAIAATHPALGSTEKATPEHRFMRSPEPQAVDTSILRDSNNFALISANVDRNSRKLLEGGPAVSKQAPAPSAAAAAELAAAEQAAKARLAAEQAVADAQKKAADDAAAAAAKAHADEVAALAAKAKADDEAAAATRDSADTAARTKAASKPPAPPKAS